MRIALIPARGGSKRIPRKNIKNFMGKPMIGWSIEAAVRSRVFDKIFVSTDDEEIATISRKYGAETPFTRPENLADDFSTTTDVVAHAIQWMKRDGLLVEAVCCIYPTAPFLESEKLTEGWEVFSTGKWDYVFSASTFPSPIQRSFKVGDEGEIEMYFPEFFSTRSQDLPVTYHDAAQFYWGKPSAWLARTPIFGRGSTAIAIARSKVQDIDTPEDWEQAELLGKLLLGE